MAKGRGGEKERERKGRERVEKICILWSFFIFIRTLVSSGDPTFMTSSKPNYLQKVPPPNTITLGVRAST